MTVEREGFDPKWFSHKFKGPGLRYKVAVCIQTGHIVWYNGHFPPGDWPDLRIAQDALIYELDNGELALVDRGYRDGHQFFEAA